LLNGAVGIGTSRSRVIAIDSVREPSSEGESPLADASAKELMGRVRTGMAELPDKQAQVFWLSCVEGLSHQQISGRMEIPPGEVRVLLHRARTHLREILPVKRICAALGRCEAWGAARAGISW
jgi:RNA polymerase sigma factor (sigma-70 family)